METTRQRTKAERDREYYLRHREAILARVRAAYAADPEKFRARVQRAYRDRPEYREACKRRSAALYRRHHERRMGNPLTRLADRLRERLFHSLRSRGLPKRGRTWNLLGYTARDLHERLRPFLGKPCVDCGAVVLRLDNVHLDHIRPIADARTEQDIIERNALSNLRLICGPCNLRKRARVGGET